MEAGCKGTGQKAVWVVEKRTGGALEAGYGGVCIQISE